MLAVLYIVTWRIIANQQIIFRIIQFCKALLQLNYGPQFSLENHFIINLTLLDKNTLITTFIKEYNFSTS